MKSFCAKLQVFSGLTFIFIYQKNREQKSMEKRKRG